MTARETRYGLFVYHNTGNLGDELQSLAALQYISGGWVPVDRDRLSEAGRRLDGLKIIGNGWYKHEIMKWPPPVDTNILLTSIHISKRPDGLQGGLSARSVMLCKDNIGFLKDREPVGARDLDTYNALREAGVRSYLSGCLTATLDRPMVERDPDLIVVNDISHEILLEIRRRAKSYKKILLVTHYELEGADQARRFEIASGLLKIYAQASAVITSRLHCVMPCLAFETPVMLVKSALDDERFSGLDGFYRHIDPNDFSNFERVFAINSPDSNSTSFKTLSENLKAQVKEFCV